MGIVIGMDEAGYGPNLGPLVITASVWQTPGPPRETDFWQLLREVVSDVPTSEPNRLHIADSKQVYSSGRSLQPLERGVLVPLLAGGHSCCSFRELCRLLTTLPHESLCEPWYQRGDLPIPHIGLADELTELIARWQRITELAGIKLLAVRSDVVLTERFNSLTEEYNSKGLALSRMSLQLLRSVWELDTEEPTWIVGDKHGGRNRYDHLLAELLDDRMIFRLEESTALSRYRVGNTEIHFRTKAEKLLPVAFSSMVCKYVRELAMELFNQFWREHLPELKPTKGYPQDARRFRAAIAELQQSLGIADTLLWRNK